MGTPVHGKRFVATWNSVTICADKAKLDAKVGEANATTSCDAEEVHLQGKPGYSASMDGPADFASSGWDATAFAGLTGGAANMTVKPSNASTSTTNPLYTVSSFVTGYSLDFGDDAVRASMSLQGTGALSRATS